MARATRDRAVYATGAVARAAWGTLLLVAPGRLLQPFGPVTTTAVVTLRVLGLRHLAQAAVTFRRPTPVTLAFGAVVDGLHAGSALALAAVDRQQRRAALANAVTATGWAVLGWWSARNRRGRLNGEGR